MYCTYRILYLYPLAALGLRDIQLHVEKSIKFAKVKFSDWDQKQIDNPFFFVFDLFLDPSQRILDEETSTHTRCTKNKKDLGNQKHG
jgi:hypothetical protein